MGRDGGSARESKLIRQATAATAIQPFGGILDALSASSIHSHYAHTHRLQQREEAERRQFQNSNQTSTWLNTGEPVPGSPGISCRCFRLGAEVSVGNWPGDGCAGGGWHGQFFRYSRSDSGHL